MLVSKTGVDFIDENWVYFGPYLKVGKACRAKNTLAYLATVTNDEENKFYNID
jgi:hypothetical protein